MLRIESYSDEQTEKLGEMLGRILCAGDVVTVDGDLGAGKTTFSHGLARGLDIADVVSSPTFTIVNQYEGRLPLAHFDWYRLETEEELDCLELEQVYGQNQVTLIEWADKFIDALPAERLSIRLEYGVNPGSRVIIMAPLGKRYEERCEEMAKSADCRD